MTNSTPLRRSRRRRRTVGSAVHIVAPETRRRVRGTRRALFQLYAPHIKLNPWRTSEEWRASRPRFLAVVLLVVLSFALYEMFSAPSFFVDAANFTGNRFTPASELAQKANVRGWSIFFLDAREVQAHLLEMPEIASVEVGLGLPNSVNVRIVERTPSFVWETRGATYWVDGEAIAFKARTKLTGVLWLKDLEGVQVKLGQRVNAEAFNAAVSLRNAWPDGPSVFEWSQAHGLAVRDSHGWLVYFGQANQMVEKVTALKIVGDQILKEGRPINFVDLGTGLPYYQEAKVQATASK